MRLFTTSTALSFSLFHAVLVNSTVATSSTTKTAAAAACNAALSVLSASKVSSSGVEYEASAHGAWNGFNQLDSPTCIVFPETTKDVSIAMKAIYDYDSHYSVRGGGHSGMPGWNTIEVGVLIDLSHMKTLSYDQKHDSIHLEPGVLWSEAYAAFEPFGVAPVGGRQGDVGVAGFLLGGGLSFLGPSSGFGCDTFRSLGVVLPSGAVVTATATNEHKDLFRALKGGGSRFGIVTHFEVDAIHVGTKDTKDWYGGVITFPGSSSLALINVTDDFVATNDDPRAVSLGIQTAGNYGYPGQYLAVDEAVLFYHGSQAEFEKTFSKFLLIPAGSERTGSNGLIAHLEYFVSSNKALYGASALYPGGGRFLDAYKHWSNFSATFPDQLYLSVLAFTPITRIQTAISRSRGSTAFTPHNDDSYVAVQIGKMFVGNVTLSQPFLDAVQLLFKQIPGSPGLPYYLNESDETQDVFATYPWYEGLKSTYAKYDPTRFNVRRMVGPQGL